MMVRVQFCFKREPGPWSPHALERTEQVGAEGLRCGDPGCCLEPLRVIGQSFRNFMSQMLITVA